MRNILAASLALTVALIACERQFPDAAQQEFVLLFDRISKAEDPASLDSLSSEICKYRDRWSSEIGPDDQRLAKRIEALDLLASARRDQIEAESMIAGDPAGAASKIEEAEKNLSMVSALLRDLQLER